MSDGTNITFDPAPQRAPTQREVYDLATIKGWHVQHKEHIAFLYAHQAPAHMIEHARATWLAARLALIHAEVSEVLELVRQSQIATQTGAWAHELADIGLRLKDLAEDTSVDLEQAQADKHAFNATRTHRHGGKTL